MRADDRLPASSWRAAVRTAAILAAATLLYAVLPFGGRRWWLGALVGAVAVVAIAPFTLSRLRAVRGSDHPLVAAGEAIVLLLAMVVYGFAAVYLAIDRRSGQFEGIDTRIDAVYFTVTTLSTVGFGDVHATGQAARLAVTIQVVFDLTLLAIAIKVLGVAAQQRRAEGVGPPRS